MSAPRGLDRLGGDRRGASTTLTHVLTLGLTVVLVSGLVIAGSALSDSQRDRAARAGLSTVGERTVAELVRVDSLVAGSDRDELTLRTQHADSIAGQTYVVELSTDPAVCGSPPCLVLETTDPAAELALDLTLETPVSQSSVAGGNFRIVYDGSTISLRGEAPA